MMNNNIELAILRKDFEAGLQKLYKEVADVLARLANNLAKDMDKLEARIKQLETNNQPTSREINPDTGVEL